MTADIYVPIIIAALFGSLAFLASWQAGKPADPLKPRLLPWRTLIIAFGAIAIIALGYLVGHQLPRTGGAY